MKKYKVLFYPLALVDIEQVVIYYNEQQNGLGKRFASQVQLALTAIKRNPFFSSIRYGNVRCAQVPKFPFVVHYQIKEPSNITTAAVYSTYQHRCGIEKTR